MLSIQEALSFDPQSHPLKRPLIFCHDDYIPQTRNRSQFPQLLVEKAPVRKTAKILRRLTGRLLSKVNMPHATTLRALPRRTGQEKQTKHTSRQGWRPSSADNRKPQDQNCISQFIFAFEVFTFLNYSAKKRFHLSGHMPQKAIVNIKMETCKHSELLASSCGLRTR